MTLRARSCPSCRSIGDPRDGCQNLWHTAPDICERGVAGEWCALPLGHDGDCNPTRRIPRPELPVDQEMVDDLVEFWHQRDHGKLLDDAARDLLRRWMATGRLLPAAASTEWAIRLNWPDRKPEYIRNYPTREAAEAQLWRYHTVPADVVSRVHPRPRPWEPVERPAGEAA